MMESHFFVWLALTALIGLAIISVFRIESKEELKKSSEMQGVGC